jgi:hypothetical protein
VSPINFEYSHGNELEIESKYLHLLEHADITPTQKVQANIYCMSLEVHTKKKTIRPGR